jgi:protein phosphatase
VANVGAGRGNGAASDTGRVRQTNEDRWLIRRDRGVTLLGVADGVGGERGGEVASAAAIDSVAARFFAELAERAPREALARAVEGANEAVVGASRAQDVASAASTLVLAAVRGREASIANLGLVHAGAARQLTTDHSGATAGSITRYVGDPAGVQPDVFLASLRGGDRLVLCSDGLTRHVREDEIARYAGDTEPQRAAERLVALANERGGEDNVTVVVHRVAGGIGLAGGLLLCAVASLIAFAAYALLTGGVPVANP